MRIIILLHIQLTILRFVSEKLIFAHFHVYFQCIQISNGALTLWRDSNVIWSSVVLILVSMDRGGSYLYTGSKYRGIRCSIQKIQGGGCNNTLRRTCYKKYLRRTRVNPRLAKLFFVTRLTKGGCYNPLPRFSKPNPLWNLVSIGRYGPSLSIHTKMSTIGQGVT